MSLLVCDRLDVPGCGVEQLVRQFGEGARRAGLAKKIGPHTLRRAFITAALDAGVPLRDVQEAGHRMLTRATR